MGVGESGRLEKFTRVSIPCVGSLSVVMNGGQSSRWGGGGIRDLQEFLSPCVISTFLKVIRTNLL